MKNFYLYLDESGSFDRDHLKLDNPSLVGGYLSTFEINKGLASRLLNTSNSLIHSVNINKDEFEYFAISVFSKLSEFNLIPVIFENTLRLRIVDGDTTYLNITAEGIVLLISKLVMLHGDISLNIVASCRVWNERSIYQELKSSTPIISIEEYKKRLEEKIIIGMANKNLPNLEKCKWNVVTQSANYESKLQISDVICHSWFRKSGKYSKFQNDNMHRVKNFFNTGFIFHVFVEDLEFKYENLINKGHIDEVIFDLLSDSKSDVDSEYYTEVVKYLILYNDINQQVILNHLFAKIHFVFKINSDLNLINMLVDNSLNILIPKLIEANLNYKLFQFDMLFLGLTLATNEGNIKKADDYVIQCNSLINKIITKWENIQYYFDYKLRLGIHLLNKYAFEDSIEEMNKLEDVINNTYDLFQAHEAFNSISEGIKSDIKGKIYGIRLMAKNYLSQKRVFESSLTIEDDSNKAISSFEGKADKSRQYQLRSWICYSKEETKEAISWLIKSVEPETVGTWNKHGIRRILEEAKNLGGFLYLHYLSILQIDIDINSGITDFSQIMYDIWNKTQSERFIDNNKHPYHLINWKLGAIHLSLGNTKAALERYSIAERIATQISYNKNGTINQALYSSLVAINVDKIYRLHSNRNHNLVSKEIKRLRKTLERFNISSLPNDMYEVFNDILDKCNMLETGNLSYLKAMYLKSKLIVIF